MVQLWLLYFLLFKRIFTVHSCPRDWILVDTTCYKYITKEINFDSAQEVCENLGAQLSTIRDLKEWFEVDEALARSVHDKSSHDVKVWIGGKHNGTSYIWNGEATMDVHLVINNLLELTSGNKYCLAINLAKARINWKHEVALEGLDCNLTQPALCQKRYAPTRLKGRQFDPYGNSHDNDYEVEIPSTTEPNTFLPAKQAMEKSDQQTDEMNPDDPALVITVEDEADDYGDGWQPVGLWDDITWDDSPASTQAPTLLDPTVPISRPTPNPIDWSGVNPMDTTPSTIPKTPNMDPNAIVNPNVTSECQRRWRRCPTSWSKYGSKCFKFNQTIQTFSDARNSCEKACGSRLAKPKSPKERNDLLQYLEKETPGHSVWIGLFLYNGKWVWMDGSPFSWGRSGIRTNYDTPSIMVLYNHCGAFGGPKGEHFEPGAIIQGECWWMFPYVCEITIPDSE